MKSNERKPSIPLSLLSFESIEKLLYTCSSYLFYFSTFGSFNCVLKCADGGSRTHKRFSSQAQPPSIYTSRYVVQSIFYKDSDRLCALPSKKECCIFSACCVLSIHLFWFDMAFSCRHQDCRYLFSAVLFYWQQRLTCRGQPGWIWSTSVTSLRQRQSGSEKKPAHTFCRCRLASSLVSMAI